MTVINISGVISAATYEDFATRMETITPSVIRINSVGGIVSDGIGIYNIIREYCPDTPIVITGTAGSMASIIALAGNKLPVMLDGTIFLIHNPYQFLMGTSKELREQAKYLDMLEQFFLSVYMRATSLPEGEIRQMLDKETIMNREQAVKLGFARMAASPAKAQSVNNVISDRQAAIRQQKINTARMRISSCLSMCMV